MEWILSTSTVISRGLRLSYLVFPRTRYMRNLSENGTLHSGLNKIVLLQAVDCTTSVGRFCKSTPIYRRKYVSWIPPVFHAGECSSTTTNASLTDPRGKTDLDNTQQCWSIDAVVWYVLYVKCGSYWDGTYLNMVTTFWSKATSTFCIG